MVMIYVLEPGEWNETLIASSVQLDEASALGKVVTSWLVEQGMIEAAQWNNVFGPIGHATGPKASSAHEEASEPGQYGLVEIWATGEATKGEGIIVMGKPGPIMMHCPRCSARQGFSKAVLDEWEANAVAAARCNTCHLADDLDRWGGGGEFACARLTITFNHWPPIKAAFKQELEQVLGREFHIVAARL